MKSSDNNSRKQKLFERLEGIKKAEKDPCDECKKIILQLRTAISQLEDEENSQNLSPASPLISHKYSINYGT